MTENDYIIVSDLQRLRLANTLIRDTMPEFWTRRPVDVHDERVSALRNLGHWIEELEALVEDARDENEDEEDESDEAEDGEGG